MKIKNVEDIKQYICKIKFPIILHVNNKHIKVDNEEFLIALIIRLYQRNFSIETLKYEEIEYVEFEEINSDLVKV